MKPTKPTPKRFYTFCIIMLSPFLAAAVFMFLGESDGAAPIPPAVKFFYFLMCLIGACGIKYSLRRTPEYDLSLDEFLAFLGLEGSSDQVNEKIIRERAERERAQEGGAMPAEQLAFARAVAAAAGYIESSEDMSPDLMYAIRQQLRRLSSGSTALENELLEIFRTGAGNWDQMCLFRRDPGRLSVFFGVLAEIITGDAVVSDDEKARFSEVAAHFGYSADEAMGMLHDSGRFRRFWNQGERQRKAAECPTMMPSGLSTSPRSPITARSGRPTCASRSATIRTRSGTAASARMWSPSTGKIRANLRSLEHR